MRAFKQNNIEIKNTSKINPEKIIYPLPHIYAKQRTFEPPPLFFRPEIIKKMSYFGPKHMFSFEKCC
jgi:hypothetical protein